MNRSKIITDFTHRVITQQPLRVAAGWAADAAKLFALTRDGRPGDTPISRWQFQAGFPVFDGVIELGPGNQILRGGYQRPEGTTGPPLLTPLPGSLDSRAEVAKPLASFLRGDQLHGGYTPGPLYALAVLAALAGLDPRRPPPRTRRPLRGRRGGLRFPGHRRRRAGHVRPVRVLLALPAARAGHPPPRGRAGGQPRPGQLPPPAHRRPA